MFGTTSMILVPARHSQVFVDIFGLSSLVFQSSHKRSNSRGLINVLTNIGIVVDFSESLANTPLCRRIFLRPLFVINGCSRRLRSDSPDGRINSTLFGWSCMLHLSEIRSITSDLNILSVGFVCQKSFGFLNCIVMTQLLKIRKKNMGIISEVMGQFLP